MSGSNGDNVKVTITGDASSFSDAAEQASKAAADLASGLSDSAGKASEAMQRYEQGRQNLDAFRQALQAAGNDLRKIDTTALQSSYNGMATAIANAIAAQDTLADKMARAGIAFRSQVPNYQAVIDATMGMAQASRSAQDSAETFQRALNPTPLQQLRTLMAEEVPAAGAVTVRTLQQNIDAANGVGAAFKSASESAAVFSKGLDPTPLARMRDLMQRDVPAAGAATFRSLQENIDAANGIGRSFNSAAASADVFTREINRIPLAQLRATLTSTASAGSLTTSSLRENIDAANGIGRAFKSAEESARTFSAALDPSPLQRLRGLMADDVPAAAGHAGVGIAGVTREIVVLGHEAMTGQFSRIPGSLMVLAERSGSLMSKLGELATQLSTTAWGSIAGFTALAGAIGLVTMRAIEAANAVREVGNAAAFMGHNVQQAVSDLREARFRLGDLGVPSSDIDKASAAVQRLSGATPELRRNFVDLLPALRGAFHNEDVEKYFGAVVQAAQGGASGVRRYLQDADLLTEANSRGLADAEAQNDRLAAMQILVSALQGRLKVYNDELLRRKQIADEVNKAGPEFQPINPDSFGKIDPLKLPAATMPQVDPETLRQNENEEKLLATERQRQALERQIRDEEARAAAATNPEDRTRAEQAAAEARSQLARVTSTTQVEAYKRIQDAAVEAGQKAAEAAYQSGATRTEITQAQLAAEQKVYQDAANNQTLTDDQRLRARRQAMQMDIALMKDGAAQGATTWLSTQQAMLAEELAGLSRRNVSSKQLELDLLNAKVNFWRQAAQQQGITLKDQQAAEREYYNAVRQLRERELRQGEAGARKGVLDKLSELNAQQAAVREDFAKTMAIEQQKIALLTAAGSQYTQKLNEELAKRATLERQHATQMVQEAERAFRNRVQIDDQDIAQRRAQLEEDVAEDRISKATMLRTLMEFIARKRAAEQADAQARLQGLDQQSEAYKKFVRELSLDESKWETERRRLNREATQDIVRQWETALSPITQAISTSFDGVIQGTQTVQEAFANMARSIVLSYARMGIEAAMKWAASQAAQLFSLQTHEAAKTATAAAGAAARGGISATETATENSSLLVRLARWIATQLGFTSATTAGAGERAIAMSAEQVAALQIQGAGARAQIAMEAAVAAAAAFADSAMLGPPGLVAAPGVSATTYGTVMAFQASVPALAVGAWNMPRDMLAQLHAGEMVVPANFASGLRGILGGSGSSASMSYSPTINAGPGGGSTMRELGRLLARSNDRMRDYMLDVTRNGSLRLPGR